MVTDTWKEGFGFWGTGCIKTQNRSESLSLKQITRYKKKSPIINHQGNADKNHNHLISVRMTHQKEKSKLLDGDGMEKKEHLCTVGRIGNGYNHYKKQYRVSSKKIKITLLYDPAIPPLGKYLKKMSHCLRDIYTSMFIAPLFTITKAWKQPTCPSVDEKVKKNYKHYSYNWNMMGTDFYLFLLLQNYFLSSFYGYTHCITLPPLPLSSKL